uniref:Uncharacterized protein n=1 Tax=Anguilla anguilla TaxID=7936 RepID=A0A0E9SYF7_ANGAN
MSGELKLRAGGEGVGMQLHTAPV